MNEEIQFLEQREHFIPVRIPVILYHILNTPQLVSEERDNIALICEMLQNQYHFDYHKELLNIRADFVPFDPDLDTLEDKQYSEEERKSKGNELISLLCNLVERCNFIQLQKEELNSCLKLQSNYGLEVEVDLDDFESFYVYYRGITPVVIQEPKWKFWKTKVHPTKEFKRVFVTAQYLDSKGGNVIVKLFKDVSVENLKIVAPNRRLLMPFWDRLKIGGTVASGIIPSAFKIVMWFFFKAVVLSGWFILVFLFVLIMSGIKGFFGFLNSKTKYMQIISSSLYYQTLSNNTGAINQLVDMAEIQEVKEILLAWYIMYLHQDKSLTEKQLDELTEAWIQKEFKIDVDFEVDDAIRKLIEKDLVQVHPPVNENEEITYSIYDPKETLRRLDNAWDNLYNFN